MDSKVFCDALRDFKRITAKNGSVEVWHITPLHDFHVLVEHCFWMRFDSSYLTLSSVATDIDAYELIELLDLDWKVVDE